MPVCNLCDGHGFTRSDAQYGLGGNRCPKCDGSGQVLFYETSTRCRNQSRDYISERAGAGIFLDKLCSSLDRYDLDNLLPDIPKPIRELVKHYRALFSRVKANYGFVEEEAALGGLPILRYFVNVIRGGLKGEGDFHHRLSNYTGKGEVEVARLGTFLRYIAPLDELRLLFAGRYLLHLIGGVEACRTYDGTSTILGEPEFSRSPFDSYVSYTNFRRELSNKAKKTPVENVCYQWNKIAKDSRRNKYRQGMLRRYRHSAFEL